MFFFLFSSFSLLFTGEWNQEKEVQVQIKMSDSKKYQKFRLILNKLNSFQEFSIYSTNIDFYDYQNKKSNQRTLFQDYQLYGVRLNTSSFFLVNIFPNNFNTPISAVLLINQIFQKKNITLFGNQTLANKLIQKKEKTNFSNIKNNITFGSLYINISLNTSYNLKTFDLPFFLNGTFIINKTHSYNLFGKLFNQSKFISEGKIYGVIMSFYVILAFYSWVILSRHFHSQASLINMSQLSIILHISFDFAHAFFLYNFTNYIPQCSNLYSFLFVVILVIYFQIQMKHFSFKFCSKSNSYCIYIIFLSNVNFNYVIFNFFFIDLPLSILMLYNFIFIFYSTNNTSY